MLYKKTFKTIEDQITILKERGLLVASDSRLENFLRNVSYYHASIYFKHFQDSKSNFILNTRFEDVLNVYTFDQKLRLLLSDMLERIEKSFKAKLINEICFKESDGNWIVNDTYFVSNDYSERVTEILERLRYSKEIYIKHFYNKYSEPDYPPAWMIVESLTFGQAVMVYRQLTTENKEIIASSYGINKIFVESWFYAFSDIRNICAHHGRLWNRELRVRPSQKHGKYKNLFYNNNGNRLFNHVLLMNIIGNKFCSGSEWLDTLRDLIAEHTIEVSHMGFPKDWRERIDQSLQ
jgi:abortive infection bacteriophage resistance protein